MTKCKNIIFHTVSKGYQDLIMYTECAERKIKNGEDHVAIIKDCVANSQYIDATPASVRRQHNVHLTIASKKGKNAYVIWLGGLPATTFVECASPIISRSDFDPAYKHFISDVTLYYTKQNNPVVATGKKDDYEKPVGYDRPMWASFVFDTDVAPRVSAKTAMAAAVNRTLQIPLYFNLYNTVFDLPNWIAANHKFQHGVVEHSHDAKGGHLQQSMFDTHGGPHPIEPFNVLEVDLGP